MTLKYISSLDLDAIADPIMKAKMVALKGINKVMAQSNMGMPPVVTNRWVPLFLTLARLREAREITAPT